MEAHPESRVPAQPHIRIPTSSLAGPSAEGVERVLARTEAAVAAIKERTERQARQIITDLELRSMEEAVARRARLEQVRHELADQATALLVAYEEIYERLGEIDAVLAGWVDQAASQGAAPTKVTVRERQRISVPYDASLLPRQAEVAPPASPPAVLHARRPSRRRWLPWQREAA